MSTCVCCSGNHKDVVAKEGDEWCQQCQMDGCPQPQLGPKRHEKPCVLPLSSNTCIYLSDGTKVVIRRGPKVKGPVWLEVVPQETLHLQAAQAGPGERR